MSKSKTPSQTRTVQTSTSIPEYARPFYEELMGRGAAELRRPVEETLYPGQRIADFDPYQLVGQRGMAEIAYGGAPQQMGMASDIASQIGYKPTNLGMRIAQGFNPQQIMSGYMAADIDPGYYAGQLGQGYWAGQRGMGYEAGPFDPGYEAQLREAQFQADPSVSGYAAGQFAPGYAARELGQDYTARELEAQYTGAGAPAGAQFGPGFEAGATQPGQEEALAQSEMIGRYMDPYQRLVTDIEKREAQRQSDIQATGTAQQAAQAGGLGGYREAIMQAERERNLAQQMGDIEARGGQAAFQQAQRSFEADRAARLQAGQLGLQTGQATEQALQQAEQMRQAAFGISETARQAQQQMQTTAYQAGEQARQQAGVLGLSAQEQAEAARQAQEQYRQGAFGQTMEGQVQEEQFGTQAWQAGEQARQQAAQLGMTAQQSADAAFQAQEQFGQAQFAQNEQMRQAQQQADQAAYQANQQAMQQAASLGLSAQQATEAGRQAANDAYMRAQEANVASGLQAAQLGMQGYGQDLDAQSQSMEAARLLGTLGGQERQMANEALRNLQASGQIRQGLAQQGLTMGYQDFQRQLQYPREQLGFYSGLLQGLPYTPSTTQTTAGGPSQAQQLLGAGIGGVGLYQALMGGRR